MKKLMWTPEEMSKVIKVPSVSFIVDDLIIKKIDCFRMDKYGLFPQDLQYAEDTKIMGCYR